MRRFPVLIAVLAAAISIVSYNRIHAASNRQPTSTTVPGAQAGIHLVAPVAADEWNTPLGDVAGTRFSALDQINTTNVKNLHVVHTMSTGVAHGHEGGPLVVNNTMYVVTPYPNFLIAVDLNHPDGPIKWKFDPHADPRSQGLACCDTVNRGAAYGDGKVVYASLDNMVHAVDANSGKQLWQTKIGELDNGETSTAAPLIVKGKVYLGSSGGELGVRGKMTALDLNTGKVAWIGWNTGPDSDVLIDSNTKEFYKKDQGPNLGSTTWPPDQWKLGGSNIWGWITYDPELNQIYYGSGNPGVWNPDMRPGDNKWSCTLFARDPDTGHVKWAYQFSAHDAWDYDEIMENIAIDMDWGGEPRKLLIHPARNGFMFVLDRETGEVLSAQIFEKSTNWASSYDLKTGKPNENPEKRTHQGSVTANICPSSTGGKEFVPTSFSPRTGYLYIAAHNTCMNYEGLEVSYIAGTPYLGASVKMFPGPGGKQGDFIAWDVKNSKPAWEFDGDSEFPLYSGVLSTAGDVVFYGTMDGWFKARDARNGTLLWQFKTGSGIIGNPNTFVGPDGKQYVVVYSGVGGWMGAIAQPSLSTSDPYGALGTIGAMAKLKQYSAPGDTVYVFGL
jgi:PQQ-dependent dehydrogenase (methanol/ethanol family)